MYRLLCLVLVLGIFSPVEAGQAPPQKIPILLDTDIGDDIDDTLALALVLASPELELRGVTTVGRDAFTRAQIVCRFLDGLGRLNIPVAAGRAPPPLQEESQTPGQLQFGQRPCFRKRPDKDRAVDFLYKKLKAQPGELTLLAIGPLTNIADLLTRYPESKGWIKRLVVMGGALRVGYEGRPPAVAEWNIKSDVAAARTVLGSGIPLVLAPLDATAQLKLDGPALQRLLDNHAPLANQVHALYQLWGQDTPVLFDPVTVALCFSEQFCRMENARLEVDDKGITRIVPGKANVRVATASKREAFVAWFAERLLTACGSAPRQGKLPRTNLAKPAARGNLPSRVHVIEDYATDIERRWWLCGVEEKKNLPPGSSRACRGVLTNDFDDLQGDPKAMYTAVIFNPVPGPPMGADTRLSFRCRLQGTSSLKVQIYTLSKGYHRHLTLTDLPQNQWLDLTVDMTQARRPDGTGGPLAQDERIDDIQFYTDRDAGLLIDDIMLYDAAGPEEKRPFPRRAIFNGWFDTGRQGQEWPGDFAIVAKPKPWSWKAARSVDNLKLGLPWIRLHLRGPRPMGEQVHLRFRYHLEGAESVHIALASPPGKGKGEPNTIETKVSAMKTGAWAEHTVDFTPLLKQRRRDGLAPDRVNEIRWLLPKGAQLLVDDVLLFAP